MTGLDPALPPFRAPLAPPDEELAARLAGRRRARRRDRAPHRRARANAGGGDPRQDRRPRRARRHRGFSARLFALDQGRAGAHGAGRGAAARARRRDRRPPDRGQARGRPLARRRHQVDRRFWCRLRRGRSGLPPASSIPARCRRRSSIRSRGGSACRPCARRRARRCGSSARISCSDRPSTKRSTAPAATPSFAIRSTCWAKARARRRTPKNISRPMPPPSRPSDRASATWRRRRRRRVPESR